MRFVADGQQLEPRLVALKEVKMRERISSRQYRDVINEVEMMKKIQHEHIIQLYDSFIDRQLNTKYIRTLLSAHKEREHHFRTRKGSLMSSDSVSTENLQLYGENEDNYGISPERNGERSNGPSSLYIVMEFAEEGDMQTLIN